MRNTVVVLAALLVAGLAFAQEGPATGTRGRRALQQDALKNYLNLTDQQVTDLKAIQDSTREALKPLRQQMAEKAKALREELKKDPIDTAAVSRLRQDLKALADELKSQRDELGKKSRNVLTTEQITSLQRLEQALALLPAARQAAAINLIEAPEGFTRLLRQRNRMAGRAAGIDPGGVGPLGRRPTIR